MSPTELVDWGPEWPRPDGWVAGVDQRSATEGRPEPLPYALYLDGYGRCEGALRPDQYDRIERRRQHSATKCALAQMRTSLAIHADCEGLVTS